MQIINVLKKPKIVVCSQQKERYLLGNIPLSSLVVILRATYLQFNCYQSVADIIKVYY